MTVSCSCKYSPNNKVLIILLLTVCEVIIMMLMTAKTIHAHLYGATMSPECQKDRVYGIQ